MTKIFRALKRVAPATAVTFCAGLLASIVVREIFGGLIHVTVGVLSLLGIAFVVLATASQVGVYEEIKTSLLDSKLGAKIVRATKATGGDEQLYAAVTECLLTAKDSIHAVSLFRPPTLKMTDARRKYYDALGKVLAEKEEVFVYDRIIQVETVRENALGSDQTDSLTFKHCQTALELNKNSPVKVYLRQTASVLGSLSFFIIDNKQVVFVIPSTSDTFGGETRGLVVGSVVIFTDAEGRFIKEMMGLFHDLSADAKRITSCTVAVAKMA